MIPKREERKREDEYHILLDASPRDGHRSILVLDLRDPLGSTNIEQGWKR